MDKLGLGKGLSALMGENVSSMETLQNIHVMLTMLV